MGSLASRPKVPAQQPQVVFVQSPAATTSVSQTPSGTGGAPADTNTSGASDTTATQQRTESLLRRSRGRFGTVQTSFRGLLSALSSGSQRKTLLGE